MGDIFGNTFQELHLDPVLEYVRNPLSTESLQEIENSINNFMEVAKMSLEEKKIGDSTKTKQVWYRVEIDGNTEPFDNIVIDYISTIYYDVDNFVIAVTNRDKIVNSYHLKPNTCVSIAKYEQVTEKILIGYEKATVEELSSPDFVPKEIYATVVHDPEIVEFCPLVNDKDGYRVLRNCK